MCAQFRWSFANLLCTNTQTHTHTHSRAFACSAHIHQHTYRLCKEARVFVCVHISSFLYGCKMHSLTLFHCRILHSLTTLFLSHSRCVIARGNWIIRTVCQAQTPYAHAFARFKSRRRCCVMFVFFSFCIIIHTGQFCYIAACCCASLSHCRRRRL